VGRPVGAATEAAGGARRRRARRGWVSHHRARGTTALFAPLLAFGILGVIGIWYPQLFGNALDMARDAFLGIGGFRLLFALFALKPLVTALCLSSGASGGLFTPTLATGAAVGGALGGAWNLAWPVSAGSGPPAGRQAGRRRCRLPAWRRS
jgi:H+/Cl- antiporter ClcA